jgi:hypothetical protein
MNPWEQYPPGDPRADPANWGPNGIYIGPTDYQPDYTGGTISTVAQPPPSIYQAGTSYSAAPNQPPPPAQQITVLPLPSTTPSYQPSVSEQVAASQRNQQGGAAAPTSGGYPYGGSANPQAVSPGGYPAPTGYATTPAGDNFTMSDEAVRRFGEYENYLAGAGGGGTPAAGAPAPGAVSPAVGGIPADPYGTTPYGSPYGPAPGAYSAPTSHMGGGYPYPAIPGMPAEQMPMQGGPFPFARTPNPMPPSGPMRNYVLGELGLPGPAWAPAGPAPPGPMGQYMGGMSPQGGQPMGAPPMGAPPMGAPPMATPAPAPPPGPTPQQQQKLLLDAMKAGADVASQQQAPQPMSGMQYLGNRLRLNQGY